MGGRVICARRASGQEGKAHVEPALTPTPLGSLPGLSTIAPCEGARLSRYYQWRDYAALQSRSPGPRYPAENPCYEVGVARRCDRPATKYTSAPTTGSNVTTASQMYLVWRVGNWP
jgi:hypothetical protein